MTEYGVTDSGFRAKRLADIREETKIAWRAQFGEGFALTDESPEGQTKGLLDERESLLWELAEAVAAAFRPSSAEGKNLDDVMALTGNTRKGATKSTLDSGRGRGTFGTTIPAGTVISVSGNSAARFVTKAVSSISVAAINEVQKLSFSADPTSGVFKLVFPEGTTADVNYNDNAAAVQAKCEAVLGAGNIAVTGSITAATGLTLTYQGTLAGSNRTEVTVTGNTLDAGGAVTITPSTTTEGDEPKSPLLDMEEEADPATRTVAPSAPAGSLTVIETPVAGMTSFTNEEDAVVGQVVESDQDARIRRIQEIQLAGAATPDAIRADLLAIEEVTAVVVFENDTDITDSDGRPPHTMDIVVQNGDEQEIADRIWATRGGGIRTIGDIVKTVVDSQGFNQTVKFSRPTDVNIYVIVDVTKNSDYPADGDDLIKQAILDNYEANTGIGDDVVVLGSAPSLACAIKDVPGMDSYSIKVGKSPSPTQSDNIVIEPREIADFDTSRITVNS